MYQITWDQYFMNLVYLIAMRSEDPMTKIGAVIVSSDNVLISSGYNGLPRGVVATPERLQRPTKYPFMVHGEANALHLAGRRGQSCEGAKLYTQGLPCTECAKAIIQHGISKIIIDKDYTITNSEKWEQEAKISKEMFDDARIPIQSIKVELVDIFGICNGKRIKEPNSWMAMKESKKGEN